MKKSKNLKEISATGVGAPGEIGNSSEAYLTPFAYVRKGKSENDNFATKMMEKMGYLVVDRESQSSYFEKVGQKVRQKYDLPYVKESGSKETKK